MKKDSYSRTNVKISLGKSSDLRSADAVIIPLTKAKLRPVEGLRAIAPLAATTVESVLKQEKATHRSAAISIVVPRSSKGAPALRVAILPTDYSEKDDQFERLNRLRALGAACAEHAKKSKCRSVVLDTAPLAKASEAEQEALLEGLHLSLYSFDAYRSKVKPSKLSRIILVGGAIDSRVLSKAETISDAVCLARDLVNTPARDCTPTTIKSTAAAIARVGRLKLKTYTKDSLTKMGADMIMSVFRGSNETPYLVTLTYKPRKPARVVALVGKGVTFDSGGLSIKSGAGMFDMKCDMAGGAAVLATMQAIARLKPNVEVRAYIPTTENMINNRATRPGDVVRALNGKTVEILNTDAEGRLILGDTLVLAERSKPDVIIDLATLTGAVINALGSDYAGLFTPSDTLAGALVDAGAHAGERLWRLPLATEYRDRLKSMVADVKNIGGSEAGAITAALFLREFVQNNNWAHLDIAGPAFQNTDKLATPKGGSGFGVRTLIRYIESLSA